MILSTKLTSVLLLSLFPAQLLAADSAAAILYSSGAAYLNGTSVPKLSAVFAGDLIQTKADSAASIKSLGSNVLVLSDSLVEIQKNAVKLEHGSVTVGTSKSMATQVGDLQIAPASATWTVFQVADTDGIIHIIARTGDLALSDGTTLPQGQETTREQTTRSKKKRGGIIPAASGPTLNSKLAITGGVIAVGGLTTWVLIQGDDPLSPHKP
jgi:hypothetical protein